MRKSVLAVLIFGVLCGSVWAVDSNGLISLWEFEEGEGTTAYDSVGTNDGTIYGANWTTGQIGGALSFDGMDDYVDVGNGNSLKPPLPVTLSAWINLTSTGSPQYVVGIDDNTSNYYGIWFYVGSAGDLNVGYGDGGSPGPTNRRSKVGTTALNADTWYHVAAVLRGPADMSIYVNGVDDEGTYSGTGGSLAYSNASSLIGIKHNSQYPFDGKIDNVRVYGRALSVEEMWELYQTELCGTEYPIISVWPGNLKFYAYEGGSDPAPQNLAVRNIGADILNYSVTVDCSWLEVDPNSGTSAGEPNDVTIGVNTSGLA